MQEQAEQLSGAVSVFKLDERGRSPARPPDWSVAGDAPLALARQFPS
jgi:hypothetical protein